MHIQVHQLDPALPLPVYANPTDAGMDLVASEDLTLEAGGGRQIVGTGIALAIPDGHVGLIHPRSGLAAKHGVTVINAPGTVDAGYRGEIKVALVNLDPNEDFEVRRGDRIAQLVIQQVVHATLIPAGSLAATDRGEGGFGSTGR